MRSKTRRLILILDAVVLLGAILFAGYRISTRVLALNPIEQKRKVDPSAQILEYYRQYPERYIRITSESWQYDTISHTATHFLTLRNSATVPYGAIEIRFNYTSSSGKILQTETVKIPGILGALGTLEVKKVKVRNIRTAAETVVSNVAKASVY